MPFIVFNQRRHYGVRFNLFTTGIHCKLLSARRSYSGGARFGVELTLKQRPTQRIVAGFLYCNHGVIEVVAPTKLIVRIGQYTDRAAAVCQRLGQLAKEDKTAIEKAGASDLPPLVLASDDKIALILPTFAPQALLWESHFEFLDLSPSERRKRFYQYLYYTGINDIAFRRELNLRNGTFAAAAFGHERVLPIQSVLSKPITDEEITMEVRHYQEYVSSFTQEQVTQHVLSYVIVPGDGRIDLSNLDRWYDRDKGELIGDHVLYRVQLRN